MDPIYATTLKYTYILSHVVGVTAIILGLVWGFVFLNGFDFVNPNNEFNFHFVCMVTGMVYFTGNSMMIWRVLPNIDKPVVKKIHTGLHVASILFAILGLFAVIDFHNRKAIPNFYSLHSWLGLVVILLYISNTGVSIYSFLYPGAAMSFRAKLLPIHVAAGYILFSLIIATCITGLTEKAFFSLPNDKPEGYATYPPAGLLINTLGLTLIFYYVMVMHIITQSEYKRPAPAPAQPLLPPMGNPMTGPMN